MEGVGSESQFQEGEGENDDNGHISDARCSGHGRGISPVANTRARGEEPQPYEGMDNGGNGVEQENVIQHVIDIDFSCLSKDDVQKIEFTTQKAAYEFYNEYGRMNGFGVRKNKICRNKAGVVVWQSFVCSAEGFRHKKYVNLTNRKRDHRWISRVGCGAELCIRLDTQSNRWYVARFTDDHNHTKVGEGHVSKIRSQRRMTEADIVEFNNMRQIGISTPNIYGSFASQSGGYHTIGFSKKHVYNQIQKQKRLLDCDVKEALKLLSEMRSADPSFYFNHSLATDGTLMQLFWSDGCSQVDFQVFGDVLAFDATYGRNTYKCPVVVFSGVNHHKQTCIFACAIVSNETEETYTWLLRQFLQAMKGKAPNCVITDGDVAMKNAIRIVFPGAHHRLCAWHLARNATANVGDPKFTQLFQKCMMGDFSIPEFEQIWESGVQECGVQQHQWVIDIYQKKAMWAKAYIKGKFFAGVQTTLRCEALHAQMGKFVKSGYSLREFVHHFNRWLDYLRNEEVEADYKTLYERPVMITGVVDLERSGSMHYTRKMYLVYRDELVKSLTIKVIETIETATSNIYIVAKYRKTNRTWRVSNYSLENEWRCNCLGMESCGIPCVHILAVLVYLDIGELPHSLILKRWCINAKGGLDVGNPQVVSSVGQKSLYMSRVGALIHMCRKMCSLAAKTDEDFADVREKVAAETSNLLAKRGQTEGPTAHVIIEENARNPVYTRGSTIGPGSGVCRNGGRGRKKKCATRCGCCKVIGHTRRTCPHASIIDSVVNSQGHNSIDPPMCDVEVDEEVDEYVNEQTEGISLEEEEYNSDSDQSFGGMEFSLDM